MRRGDVGYVHQFQVDVRLVLPGVDDDGSELGMLPYEGILVHEIPACRIDECRSQPHFGEEFVIGDVACIVVGREVERDDVAAFQQGIEVAEIAGTFLFGPGRVVAKYLESEVLCGALDHLAGASDSDYPEGRSQQWQAPPCRRSVKGGKYIVHYSAAVAPCCIGHYYSVVFAERRVYVAGAYSRGCNYLNGGAQQQFGVAFRSGAAD